MEANDFWSASRKRLAVLHSFWNPSRQVPLLIEQFAADNRLSFPVFMLCPFARHLADIPDPRRSMLGSSRSIVGSKACVAEFQGANAAMRALQYLKASDKYYVIMATILAR